MKGIKLFFTVLLTLILVVAIWFFGSIYGNRWFGQNKAEAPSETKSPSEATDDKQKETKVKKEDVKPEDLGEGNVIQPEVKDELLFLMAGLDENNFEGQELTRSDTLVLFKVNFDTGTIDLVSIPRDTRVEVRGRLDKINHASAYEGIGLTMKTVRDFLDIDLDYYVKMNFESVQTVVDTVGGIEIYVPDVIAQGTGLPAGTQTLNGAQALKYVRFRYGYEDGDIGRVKAQQDFLSALIKQMTKLENLPRLPIILDTIMTEIDTNIPLSLVIGHIPKVNRFGGDKIQTHVIPGTPQMIDGIYYYIPEKAGTEEIVNSVLQDYKHSLVNP